MPFEVQNKIAIVTGSAQGFDRDFATAKGFGRDFAKRLLDKGAKVCISDVNEEQGLKTVEEFSRTYGKSEVTFKRYF